MSIEHKNSLTLEDDPCDIIGKAMRGQGISIRDIANQIDESETAVQQILNGAQQPSILKKLAARLALSLHALKNLSSYTKETAAPKGLYKFTTTYGYLGVNAYIIKHGENVSLFDTGTDASPILKFIQDEQLKLDTVYITHRHPDHTDKLSSFKGAQVVYPEDIHHGDVLHIGNSTMQVLDVSGHATPARAFFYNQLEKPVCISGDSIFAGSMGKTNQLKNYLLAISTAKKNILTLPRETIICPGHGPMTNVAQELEKNPFFAKDSVL